MDINGFDRETLNSTYNRHMSCPNDTSDVLDIMDKKDPANNKYYKMQVNHGTKELISAEELTTEEIIEKHFDIVEFNSLTDGPACDQNDQKYKIAHTDKKYSAAHSSAKYSIASAAQEKSDAKVSENNSCAITLSDFSVALANGVHVAAVTIGDNSISEVQDLLYEDPAYLMDDHDDTIDWSRQNAAIAIGARSHAVTNGDGFALATGVGSLASSCGGVAIAGNSFSMAEAFSEGDMAIAMNGGMAKGVIGSYLVLFEKVYDEETKLTTLNHIVKMVDGETIKANTYYTLKNGIIVETKPSDRNQQRMTDAIYEYESFFLDEGPGGSPDIDIYSGSEDGFEQHGKFHE